ncbi:MAG: DUF1844 domain-containing protein [Acidobacteriota bacterium]
MSEAEREAKGFKVTDRRKFTPEGDPRREETQEKPDSVRRAERGEKARASTTSGAPKESSRPEGAPAAEPPREVAFLDLVSMLANNALVQMGDVPDPVSGQRVEDLKGVRVMIDFLALLQDKTKGNLSENEARALEGVLYDLRMRFMAKANLIKL